MVQWIAKHVRVALSFKLLCLGKPLIWFYAIYGNSYKAYFREILKVNKSRYIVLFVVSRSIKKLFSINFVNIYLFSIFFSIIIVNFYRFSKNFQYYLPGGKVWGYLTLLISWFINFKIFDIQIKTRFMISRPNLVFSVLTL